MLDTTLIPNSFADRKTYAEFLHPGEVNLGQVEYSLREVAQNDRDPRCLPGPPSDALGVRFFDQIEVEVTDTSGVRSPDPIVCKSSRLDVSPGVIFYGGTILDRNAVETGTLPSPLKRIVLHNMRNNNWDLVIFIRGIVLPFDVSNDSIR